MNAPVTRLTPAGGDLQQVQRFLGVTTPKGFHIPDGADVRYFDKAGLEQLMLERGPFFFIDRAVAFEWKDGEGKTQKEVWTVANMTRERSEGHFPGRPIIPLIELCKAMAQSGIVVASLEASADDAPIAIGSGESRATARDLIQAPAMILVRATLTKQRRMRMFWIDGTCYIDGQEIGTLVNIWYMLVERDRLMGKTAA